MAQQVKRRTGISKERVQTPLESTFFSWLRQCQIIMKKFCSCISLWMILKRSNFVGELCCIQHCLIVCHAMFIEHFVGLRLLPIKIWPNILICPTDVGEFGRLSNKVALLKWRSWHHRPIRYDQLATCFSIGEIDIYVKNHTKEPSTSKVMKVCKDSDNENSIGFR